MCPHAASCMAHAHAVRHIASSLHSLDFIRRMFHLFGQCNACIGTLLFDLVITETVEGTCKMMHEQVHVQLCMCMHR